MTDRAALPITFDVPTALDAGVHRLVISCDRVPAPLVAATVAG